jgi:hypothetical protein
LAVSPAAEFRGSPKATEEKEILPRIAAVNFQLGEKSASLASGQVGHRASDRKVSTSVGTPDISPILHMIGRRQICCAAAKSEKSARTRQKASIECLIGDSEYVLFMLCLNLDTMQSG